jgi:hypothetical protein
MPIFHGFAVQRIQRSLIAGAAVLLLGAGIARAQDRQWTWIKGSGAINQPGVYGDFRTPDAANTPGSREESSVWTDYSGGLWLFGGIALDSGGDQYANDLWRFDIGTQTWTWMKGSNIGGQPAVFGTKGIPDPANTPGARWGAISWTDSSGNLWLFGGVLKVGSSYENYNDLWSYNPASGNWTWVSGTKSGSIGFYGSQGVPDPSNAPGSRRNSIGWADRAGGLWLFGGYGSGETSSGPLNDLWRYDIASGIWTWMKGSKGPNQAGVYGVQGTPDAANSPGARIRMTGWTDTSGNFWMFGGATPTDRFNDLWRYSPATGDWTWMKGPSSVNQTGNYGVQGVSAASNLPSSRSACPVMGGVARPPASDVFWLLGGQRASAFYNDLWRYDVATNNWTWVKGRSSSGAFGNFGVFGTQGEPAAANTPSVRANGVAWLDQSNAYWIFGGGNNTIEGVDLNDLWRFDPAWFNAAADWEKFR